MGAFFSLLWHGGVGGTTPDNSVGYFGLKWVCENLGNALTRFGNKVTGFWQNFVELVQPHRGLCGLYQQSWDHLVQPGVSVCCFKLTEHRYLNEYTKNCKTEFQEDNYTGSSGLCIGSRVPLAVARDAFHLCQVSSFY